MSNPLKKASLKLDLYFLLLVAFVYAFCTVIWFIWASDNLMFVIMLNVMFLFVVTSYFTSMMFCLSACVFFVFSYGSYILYLSLSKQYPVNVMSYFWILAIPLICIVVSFFRKYMAEVQAQIHAINEKLETTVGFHENTNLLNERMFHKILNNYIAMASRKNIELCVMLIKLNYFDDIAKIIGAKAMDDLLKTIADSIDGLSRSEDLAFFLDEEGVFSLIMISNLEGADRVKKSIKASVKDIDVQEKVKSFSLKLELKIGIAEYTADINDSIELRNAAKTNMEYDV